MARVLIVGCGCRGRALARELRDAGHTLRGTTRDPARAAEIETDGIEPCVADPDRLGALVAALDGVAVVCWLLGSATGPDDGLETLHGPRLRALLERTVDTGVRGFVYERAGDVDRGLLERGAETVREAAATWAIPIAFVDEHPAGFDGWLAGAVDAVDGLLGKGAKAPLHSAGRQIP